jgi:hypothetical protein
MKTIKILTAIVVLTLTTSNVFADSIPYSDQKKIINKIGRHLDFPQDQSSVDNSSFVLIEFVINKDGSLTVTELCGKEELKDYVTGRIENIKIDPDLNLAGKTLQYRIEFLT